MRIFLKFMQPVALVAFAVLAASCNRNDPEPENETEEINTLLLTMSPLQGQGGTPAIFSFSDLDGPGGNAPVITGPVPLRANTTYEAFVVVGKAENGVVEDKTTEVDEEGYEHQFFYVANPASLVQFTATDTDRDNRPIGILTRAQTGAAGTGTLRIVLRHDLNKAFAGLNNTNYLQAGGETDVEVTFNITVQ
ncbi:MAG: hypothetical protein MUC97_11920 [Bernardetiaceae bacterium]|jgi:hypothetical protein|nr:hypothetical protein [Bernardetiaceae bacterium]